MDVLEQAKQTFIEESRELLQQFEDALLGMGSGDFDAESVNSAFRAAHTIKGSAGLFGLERIVRFTHGVENVLDRLRGGGLQVSDELVSLLLGCRDHMAQLIEDIAAGAEGDAGLVEVEAELTAALQAYRSDAKPKESMPVEPPGAIESCGGSEVDSDHWHISLRFGPDVLRDGMDPLSFIRYLGTFGQILSITTLPDGMPGADRMDPENCYLGFEIAFKTDADKRAIEDAFEFIRQDSTIRILPPHSKVADYLKLISELPENPMRLGEILVSVGTLTRLELDEALLVQREEGKADSSNQPPRQIGEILVEQGVLHQPTVDAALAKQKQVEEKKAVEQRLIKVQADKLDSLINLVGELVIAGASANLLASRSHNSALMEATSVISRLVEEIRDNALQLRMVQIGETFNRFNRVVRDVSKDLGKAIELKISGAETELDKTVVEKIGDPLMHLVRNAMDHGIEPVAVRRSQGKREKATLHLNAYHDSGSIVIEVIDDGCGLNQEKIRAKAIERGLVDADQEMTEQEIFDLVMEPGFSTADQVTNLSGRGVGMDVVKRNITALRGSVELNSSKGVGTTVRIRLPLTLAIIDGFLVGVAETAWVIPLDMVVECVELGEADRKGSGERNYINLRGEILPFLRLRDFFDIEGKPAERENVVVVQYGSERSGIVVDELLGEFQTVIKPLGKLFSQLRGIGGSTILGSGEVALILDVPALVKLASDA